MTTRKATLTTCYEYTDLKDGRRPLLKLWLLLPRCGDGERSFLGVAGHMGHAAIDLIELGTATRMAERSGYTVEVSP